MVLSHRVSVLLLLAVACKDPDKTGTDTLSSLAEAADAVAPDSMRAFVGEPVTLDGALSSGETFRWTSSDGQSLEGAIVQITFDAPGNYSVILEVTDAEGRKDTDSLSVAVTWPPSSEEIDSSSTTLAGEGEILYAALTDLDEVIEIDAVASSINQRIPVCDGPRSLISAYGARWVSCPDIDTVTRVDASGRIDVTLPYGSRPFGLVASGGSVYVALQGEDAVAEISPEGVLGDIEPLLEGPRTVAAAGDWLYLARWRSEGDRGEIAAFNRALPSVQEIALPFDEGPDSDTNARGLPNLLGHVAIRPDGRLAAVSGLKSNTARGLLRDGQPLTFETVSRAYLRLFPLDGVQDDPVDALFDDRDQVIASAWSPLGEWLYVLFPGVETVEIRDGYTLAVSGALQGIGSGADGLWLSEDGSALWVLAQHSRTLTKIDTQTPGLLAPREALDLLPPGGEPLDPVLLQGKILFGRSVDPRMSGGGYLSCASCHPDGDHDGLTWDFTDRGEGLRNTISLLGKAGSAPIHWSANFDELQDFENDIRNGQGGAGFLTDEDFAATEDTLGAPKAGLSADLDALAAYISSLAAAPRSAGRSTDGSLGEEAALGEQIFLDPALRCAECHPPPTYTDSQWIAPGEPLLHDVGTLTAASGMRRGGPLLGLDTPTLLGLSSSGPYLHDGSEDNLYDVLVTRNPSDTHGVTSHLTAEEISALMAFLLSL